MYYICVYKNGKQTDMTYLEFKNSHKEINNKVDKLSDKLNSYDWENEEVRMYTEFQTIKKQYNKAFKNLQDFNKTADKKHQRQLRKEMRGF